mgnify:CR=1 FL=1
MLTREDPLETKSLITPRLTLIPATAALVQAEIGPQDLFSQTLGAKVPENWPPELLVDVLPFFLEQLEQDPTLVAVMVLGTTKRSDRRGIAHRERRVQRPTTARWSD